MNFIAPVCLYQKRRENAVSIENLEAYMEGKNKRNKKLPSLVGVWPFHNKLHCILKSDVAIRQRGGLGNLHISKFT